MSQSNRPAITKTLVTSAARTTSSNSGNLKDTATDFSAGAKTVTLSFHVTAFTTNGVTGTSQARFYVDTSPDSGTTWLPAAVASVVTTSTAERKITFRNGVPDGIDLIDEAVLPQPVSTTTSKLATLHPLAMDKRIRWELGDGTAAGSTTSVTFAVYAFTDPDN